MMVTSARPAKGDADTLAPVGLWELVLYFFRLGYRPRSNYSYFKVPEPLLIGAAAVAGVLLY